MRKIFALIFILCISPLSYAENKTTLFDYGDFVMEMSLKKEKGWDELLDIFVSCSLDEICILQSLRQNIAFGAPTDLIKNVFAKYDAKQTQIYQYYQHCRQRNIVRTKEQLSVCYAKFNDPEFKNLNNTQLLTEASQCMERNLISLAEKNNVFAIQALIDLYEETGKKDAVDIWKKVLDTHKDNPDLIYVEKCIENMHILD